jgi:hypothetical protein
VHTTFTEIGIDGEIAHLKRSEILKEMAALRRRHAKIAEARFDDHARAGDFVPLHRNAEPGFIRAPPAYADQEVGEIFVCKLGVEVGHLACRFLTVAAFKVLRIDHHHITKISDAAIAENPGALCNKPLRIDFVDARAK